MSDQAKLLPGSKPATGNPLFSPSFQGLLWTNWLTAINDNVFRWLVIGIGKDFVDPQNQSMVLMAGTACFALPYLLFPAPAGFVADRFSKRHVIVACKFAEIVVMFFGVIAIVLGNFWLLLFVLFLMGAQSAMFAPAKVGKIPELMDEESISAANGFFNLSSLTATIIGMFLGLWLKDQTGFLGQENIWLSALMLIGIAVAGTVISLVIKPLPPANPKLTFPPRAIFRTAGDLQALYRMRSLFYVALGIVFFWSIGALGQINIDQFAEESGAVVESQRAWLLISLVLGVGLGSVMAGWLSSGHIEMGLIPWGALGIVVFGTLAFFSPAGFLIDRPGAALDQTLVCIVLALLGMSAGIFDVPLASYLQHHSPAHQRGAIFSATNLMIFSGIILFSVLFSVLRSPTFAGSFANLPADVRGANLNETERSAVDQIDENFAAALANWADDPTGSEQPDLTTYLAKINSQDSRKAAMARLLWTEMNWRREQGEEFNKEEYLSRFRGDQQSMLLAKDVHRQLSKLPLISSRGIFLVMGLLALPVFLFTSWKLIKPMVRTLLWTILRVFYRIRVNGLENVPQKGPGVLVGNHVTYLDGTLTLLMSSRILKGIAWSGNFKSKFMMELAKFGDAILISTGPKSIKRGLETAHKAVEDGNVIVIFPEGGLTRNGQVQGFKPGLMKIIDGLDVPIIPIYFDETWGSMLGYASGKVGLRWPTKFRRYITINIGKPLSRADSIHFIRQGVLDLGADSVNSRQGKFVSPPRLLIRQCKLNLFRPKISDSTGEVFSGGKALMRATILRRLLRHHVLDREEQFVGVLLPPSVGATVVNVALAFDRRIAVNLNYTVSSELMNKCIRQAEIKHVLTSRKVMEKFDFDLDADVVYLDDLRDKLSIVDKLVGAATAYVTPASIVERMFGLHHDQPDDLLTVIFTSGSTGDPKGVMLTHRNIGSNVEAIDQMIRFKREDTMIGVLPFFHSFGYTVTLWAPLSLDFSVAYHFNPLDAKQVSKLVSRYSGTVLLGTPTFLRSYLKRCDAEDFKTVDTVIAGAEKLPNDLCDAFEKKFGVRPVEGYGATELSPLCSVNIPPSRSVENFQPDCKAGTVGRPIPNSVVKVTDLDDDSIELDANQSGMLWVKGPNVMPGYLHRPDLTEEVLIDGWYRTGDVALIDSDGFIKITGRMSRFSKIGGEMVPHVQIEDTLVGLLGEEHQDEPILAVTAVPDTRKGERLVVIHSELPHPPNFLCRGLRDAGLPNIYIPSEDSFHRVEELPILGTGKLDLKRIQQIAIDQYGQNGSTA